MLDEFGYQVASVYQLRSMLREPDYDIAVLDVHINGRNVSDFADLLAGRGTPFVFATGYGERGIPERHRSSPVLQKPFQPDELKRILADISPPWRGSAGGTAISAAEDRSRQSGGPARP